MSIEKYHIPDDKASKMVLCGLGGMFTGLMWFVFPLTRYPQYTFIGVIIFVSSLVLFYFGNKRDMESRE